MLSALPFVIVGCSDSVEPTGYARAAFCDGRSACDGDAHGVDLDGDACADRCEVPTCETFAPVDCDGAMPVDLDHDGCARECPGTTTGELCGGFAGFTCGDGEFCDYPLGQYCGYADGSGTCRPLPEACTFEYAPVCGCDGETYGNECAANAAGVSVRSWGGCDVVCPAYYPICEGGAEPVDTDGDGCALECPTATTACGGLTPEGTPTCPAGSFCDYEPGDLCGAADAQGVCRTIPSVCTEEYAPVCGCDGETYSNDCDAASHGVGVEHVGRCD